ncbi:MAG: WG repeat-containing protein [Acidobacteria bacterium]|nr:MAG: WG repeat-containing protein [Acidobacteriota bacterium]
MQVKRLHFRVSLGDIMNARVRSLLTFVLVTLFVTRLSFACTTFVMILLWTKSPTSSNALFRFADRNKVGFIDASGRVVIPPGFEADANRTGDFAEGLVAVQVDGGWAYVDANGRTVLEPQFIAPSKFAEGVAATLVKTETRFAYGYIDKRGTFVIPPEFQSAGDFAEGLAPARKPHPDPWKSGLAGYIDHSGAFVIPPQFAMAQPFSEGRARVVQNGLCWFPFHGGKSAAPGAPSVCGRPTEEVTEICRQGFIDHFGKMVIDAVFEDASEYQEGLAAESSEASGDSSTATEDGSSKLASIQFGASQKGWLQPRWGQNGVTSTGQANGQLPLAMIGLVVL